MRPILFQIGSLPIYSYGLMIALGMTAAVLLGCFRAKRFYGMNPDPLFDAGIVGLIAGLLGAKLMYWIVEFPTFIQDPLAMIKDFGNGFVVYGGVILGVLAPVLFLKFIRKTEPLRYLEIAIPSIALGQAIGRIGCVLSGCCYGNICDTGVWYAFTLPGDFPRYPTQIMSSIGDLLLCGFLLFYTNREKFAGELTVLYMTFYAVGRFVIEIFRGDPRGNVGALSTSEFVSILMFAGGIGLWFLFRKWNVEPLRRIGRYVKPDKPEPKGRKEKKKEAEDASETDRK